MIGEVIANGANQMQRMLATFRAVGTAECLAIDGHEARTVAFARAVDERGHPIQKCPLKLLGLEQSDHAANGVTARANVIRFPIPHRTARREGEGISRFSHFLWR